MRSIVGILLLLIGAFCTVYALSGLAVSLTRIADWVSAGDWSRIVKVTLAIAVSGTLAWFSLRASWRRRADILNLGRLLLTMIRMTPRLPLTGLLGLFAVALLLAALIVAFLVNPIELPAYASDISLSWDPTHTAEKYLFLGLLAAIGSYLVFRFKRPTFFVGLLPALMLAAAIPAGAAGYEAVANRWSFAAWHASAAEMASLRGDRYVYMQDRRAESGFVIRIRPDVMEGLQMMRAAGFQSDWSGLEEMESEADARTTTGWLLLVLFFGLVGGAGWLIYRDRAALSGAEA